MASNSPLRILLIDDNLDTCEALSVLFTMYGHSAVAVQSGLEAVELAEQDAWDLALVDLGLPDLDGYEVARRIRKLRGSGIKLVAVSGREPNAEKVADATFDEYHVKPLEMSVLESLLT